MKKKLFLKELQRDPAKGKFLHADFQRVSRKTKLKVVIPVNFINEEECVGVKVDGGVVAKTIREIEIMCLAGNIPESIDIDIENLNLGDSIRLTEISLPEGSEIPGLTEETDQMVVSVNAPKAVEEEPLLKKLKKVKDKKQKKLLKALVEMSLQLLKKLLKKIALKKASLMYKLCIVGLGNPDKKYNNTRHNIGKDWLIRLSKVLQHNIYYKIKI